MEPERVFGARGDAPFVAGKLEALPFAGASFDGAVALDVLEHLEDDRAATAELARVVRPGGAVVVTVPALSWLWSEHDDVNHHHRRYDARGLTALLEGAGLTVASWTYFNSLLFPPIAAARLLGRLRRRTTRPRSDFELDPTPGALAGLLEGLFALERHALGRLRLPIGVSLLAIARRP